MANLPSTTHQDTGSMMFIGETCSLDDCGREDFLPFRCPDCSNSFCVSHFRPTAHQCSLHNPSSGDFFVPLCPLCHLPPKNWSRDQDPNIAMTQHLDSLSCPALDQDGKLKDDLDTINKANQNRPNKRRIKRENECQVLKCRKIMMVPIDCKECQGKYCVEHRGVKEHKCSEKKENLRNSYRNNSRLFSGSNGARKASMNSSSNAGSNGASNIGADMKSKFSKLNLGASSSPSPPSTKPLAAQATPTAPISSSDSRAKDTKASARPFDFLDKSDKRAKSERASQIKALKARHAKGLLSNAEQLRLAEEMALEQKESGKKEDCIIC